MKTLAEHNAQFRQPCDDTPAGVLCNICKHELVYDQRSMNCAVGLTTHTDVRCPHCGHRGTKLSKRPMWAIYHETHVARSKPDSAIGELPPTSEAK